jgi:hypothetical protein
MAGRYQPRFDLGALMYDAGAPSYRKLADALGLPHRTVQRWAQEGGVPMRSAEDAALALGVHPASLWPEWYTAQAAYYEAVPA